MLGTRALGFLQKLKPAAPSIMPLPAQGAATKPISPAGAAPAGQERGEEPAVAAEPSAAQIDHAEPEKPAEAVVARIPPAEPVAATAPAARTKIAAIEPPNARVPRTKGTAKTSSAAGGATKKTVKYHDPFEPENENTNEPKAATPSDKPGRDHSAGTAKSEIAPKSAAGKSHDSLDTLMADVVTDNKGKNKKRENKDIDAMLKDVQKSNPEPPPKREAPPPLPPLAPADISRVMAGVKSRGNDCAQRLGAKGVAELKLVVGKDGKVNDVRVGGKLANTPLGACIEKAARAASFPPSSGLRFDYRIDVR